MMGRDITSADISNTIPVEQQTETVASNVISAEEQAKLLQYLESLEQKLQSLRQEYLLQQQIDSLTQQSVLHQKEIASLRAQHDQLKKQVEDLQKKPWLSKLFPMIIGFVLQLAAVALVTASVVLGGPPFGMGVLAFSALPASVIALSAVFFVAEIFVPARKTLSAPERSEEEIAARSANFEKYGFVSQGTKLPGSNPELDAENDSRTLSKLFIGSGAAFALLMTGLGVALAPSLGMSFLLLCIGVAVVTNACLLGRELYSVYKKHISTEAATNSAAGAAAEATNEAVSTHAKHADPSVLSTPAPSPSPLPSAAPPAALADKVVTIAVTPNPLTSPPPSSVSTETDTPKATVAVIRSGKAARRARTFSEDAALLKKGGVLFPTSRERRSSVGGKVIDTRPISEESIGQSEIRVR